MRYHRGSASRRSWPRNLVILLVTVSVIVVGATAVFRYIYSQNLKPLSSSQKAQNIEIVSGSSVDEIANLLQNKKIIRSAWAFKLYVSSKELRASLEAGAYEFAPNQSVAEIVSQLSGGKVATNLITILPGQRLDQIKARLIQAGFKEVDVKAALNPANYPGNPALVDKPAGASLEGYIYPDSYQKDPGTTATDIIKQALQQMNKHLTPELRADFASHGLSTYQGIILASIVENEVSTQSDRDQVAQVFLKRLSVGINLQSDVTAFYGDILAGHRLTVNYDTPYNTYFHAWPPTPISNMSSSALNAVAKPATTDWLYFVAGDDGTTYFANTLAEHQANIEKYCIKLCGSN